MAIAKGTAKVVAYKKETAWGTLAGATGAKQLRRVTANFTLVKETYESGEIRTDRQLQDFRHGVRSVDGSLNGELSPKTYSDFMQSIVARDFTAGTAVTGVALAVSGPNGSNLYTLTRTTGSWLTDGFQVGNVLRMTAGTGANADTLNKNLLVAVVSALVITVSVVNGSTLTAAPTVTAADISVTGKTTFIPATGHTEDSYTFEEWYSDALQSEVVTGVKVGTMNVQLPATGLTTVDFSFKGKDRALSAVTQYFTTPTAQGAEGIFAAVSGVMLVNGAPVALVTSADFSVERAMENATAIGSNSIADIFSGRIRVSGNLSIYFQDSVFRDYFDNETPVSLVMTLAGDSTATSPFVSFTLPKVKLGTFTRDDGELGLVAQASFQALLNDVGTTGLPLTTLSIQDSGI